jgi:hypothetical protein
MSLFKTHQYIYLLHAKIYLKIFEFFDYINKFLYMLKNYNHYQIIFKI